MRWWNRISYRLTVFILFLAIVPLAGFGITTIRDIRQVRLLSVEQIHGNMAKHSVDRIESVLSDTGKKIQLVAETTELESADSEDQEWILQVLIKSLPHLYTLTLADTKGREMVKVGRETVYSSKNLGYHTDHPDFLETEAPRTIIGALHEDTGKGLILDMYIPLLSPMDRHVIFVLVAEIDIETLLNFTADLRVGTTGYVYIVNENGKILVHPDHSTVLAGENALYNPLVQDFVSGLTEFAANRTYVNRKQVVVLTNVRAVTAPKLLVVVAQSVDEALATVARINTRQTIILVSVLVLAIFLSLYFTLKLTKSLGRLASGVQRIGSGDLTHRIKVTASDELGIVTQSFNRMAEDLESVKRMADQQNWLKQGASELDDLLRGDLPLEKICTTVLTFMARYLNEQVGLIYIHDGKGSYRYMAGYAFQPGKKFQHAFQQGEGLSGQAVHEKKILTITHIPADYISVTSGLGGLVPTQLNIVPFVFNDQVEAVMELGSLVALTQLQQRFLAETADSIAIIIAGARSRQDLNTALVQTQQQTEVLQNQQEELQSANEEMEEQTQMLMVSETKLKEQQEELQAANEELEEKTEYLERNKKNIEEKNQALEQLRRDLEKKAEDLAIASKYKSEFLANMSHELRTPLNSLLLLSRLLADNREKNLSDEQIESANIIYNSGNDLLSLINEILDLSKIEAGKMTISKSEIRLTDLKEALDRNFRGLAKEKGLALDISISSDAPDVIVNDQQRIMQVLKNFVSNAFKFTSTGGITIEFYRPDHTIAFSRRDLLAPHTIAIAVTDTGIGIARDQQKIIFEAFQQVEGSSSRKYGGTGLGLSISRELAHLLGGEIHLQSRHHTGSTFTLFLPITADKTDVSGSIVPKAPKDLKKSGTAVRKPEPLKKRQGPLKKTLSDDRDKTGPDDKVILIIEDDADFALTLLKFCREKGFKGLIALTGEAGLELAQNHPLNAIILDIHLPGIDGWTVLESLKENPATRHIPVHFMSADDPVPEAFTKGAMGYLTKPVSREALEGVITHLESIIDKKMKDLLLVEDNPNQRHAIAQLISGHDVAIQEVSNGKDAIVALTQKQYDCMILDLGLPDMSGFDLLKRMEKDDLITAPPVIVYTGRDLTQEEEQELRKYSETIIIKGVRSEERLLDETSLFLHRVVERMPEEKRKMISDLHDMDRGLQDRTILIVDDDMRNVFALSKVLHAKGITAIKAENGLKALEILENRNDIDLVLMDIMMPVMDGYETMKKIRAQARFDKLPIIALTAKAMQRDKEDCMAAGANDYLVKPLEMDRLLSMMRVWLYR